VREKRSHEGIAAGKNRGAPESWNPGRQAMAKGKKKTTRSWGAKGAFGT